MSIENSESPESGNDMNALLDAAASDMAADLESTIDSPDETIQDDAATVETGSEVETEGTQEVIEQAEVETEDSQSELTKQELETTEQEKADQSEKPITQPEENIQQEQTQEIEPTNADYKNLQKAYTEGQQSLKALQDEVSQMRQNSQTQQNQEAENQRLAALKPYQPGHPEHQNFLNKSLQMDLVHGQIQGLATTLPGDDNAVNRDNMTLELGKPFTQQDWVNWQESKAFDQQRQQEMINNPQGYIGDMVQQQVSQAIGAQQANQNGEQAVNDLFANPEFMEAVNYGKGGNEFGAQMELDIRNGMDFQVAGQFAMKNYQIQKLTSAQTKVQVQTNTNNERKRLQQGDSVVEVNPAVNNTTSVDERLKAQGVAVGDSNYNDKHLDMLFEEDGAFID